MKDIYLVRDLARLSGHTIHTIKYYLKIGIIKEISRSPTTKFRYFDETTLKTLKKIHRLQKKNLSLIEIKKIIDNAR